MNNTLPLIKYGTTPNVLLLGNGLNLCIEDYGISWNALLKSISLDEYKNLINEFKNVPYPLKPVIFTKDHVDKSIDKFAKRLMPKKLCNEHTELIKSFADLPFDAILTTNYSYEIEQSVLPDFYCGYKTSSKYRVTTQKVSGLENKFSIFKYYKLGNTGNIKNVWHIHGEAAHPDGMVLGHYYYGELLSIIQQQINPIIKNYHICQKRKIDYKPQSWIDYFLLGNVYIVGFGMDLSEIDIWWLLNCKSRHFKDCGVVRYYDPDHDKKSKMANIELAKAYNVQIDDEVRHSSSYKSYYQKICRKGSRYL